MDEGSVWNGWQIDKLIGEGSFGKVYKITKEDFGSRYEAALKIIRIPQNKAQLQAVRNEGMDDEAVRKYFYGVVQGITSEFALLSELSGNSNIVSYEDHTVEEIEGDFGWDIYLRMELVTPLYEHLKDRTLTEKDVIRLGIDICRALDTCQKSKIIHRDIKPDNIFYSRQGTYKLGDFGIARKLEKMDSNMTKVGTLSYMAPEVYKGEPYDSTADIYSLGLLLYQFMNNNRRPFLPPFPEPVLYSDNEEAGIRRMSGEAVPAPCNAGKAFSDVILKALAYDRNERYQSAAEMEKDLEEALSGCDTESVVFPYRDAESGARLIDDEGETADETVTMFHLKGMKEPDEKNPEGINEPDEKGPDEKVPAAGDGSKAKGSHKRAGIIAAALLAAIVIFVPLFYSYMNKEVPDVTGMKEKAGIELLERSGLKIDDTGYSFSDTVEKGDIVTQSVKPGKRVKRGTGIGIEVSRGKKITMPDLTGMEMEKAEKKAEKLGLVIDASEKEFSKTIPEGCIIGQSVEKGTACEEGTKISVTVSKGVKKVKVKDVTGKERSQAEKILKESSLKVTTVTQYSNSVAAGLVISQYPAKDALVKEGAAVTIYVSSGRAPVVSLGTSSGKKKSSSKAASKSASKKANATKHAKGKKL